MISSQPVSVDDLQSAAYLALCSQPTAEKLASGFLRKMNLLLELPHVWIGILQNEVTPDGGRCQPLVTSQRVCFQKKKNSGAQM